MMQGMQKMRIQFRKNWLVECLLFVAAMLANCSASAQEIRNPTVGAEGIIEQIILPGTELTGRPIEADSPFVTRVVQAFVHGDSYRYDIQFHGLEPGDYNLAEYLVRIDGTSTDGLPEIPVTVESLLPPGQIQPNKLELGWLPRLGGYRVMAVIVAVFWLAGLLALIFVGKKKVDQKQEFKRQVTLADLLQPRLKKAAANQLTPNQYAELERMLFAYWRKRLGLESATPEEALVKIHANAEAGPLMKQLEQWMHNPVRQQDFDLGQLLSPYQNLPADSSEFSL